MGGQDEAGAPQVLQTLPRGMRRSMGCGWRRQGGIQWPVFYEEFLPPLNFLHSVLAAPRPPTPVGLGSGTARASFSESPLGMLGRGGGRVAGWQKRRCPCIVGPPETGHGGARLCVRVQDRAVWGRTGRMDSLPCAPSALWPTMLVWETTPSFSRCLSLNFCHLELGRCPGRARGAAASLTAGNRSPLGGGPRTRWEFAVSG